MATNIHEHKDNIIPLIIHYYLLRAFRTLHKSFTLNHKRLVFPDRLGVARMQLST